ncbi:hypothetical protein [Winogradskyella sp.]
MKPLKLLAHLLVILCLTILTQLGGLIWLISMYISQRWRKKIGIVFPLVYLICNLVLVPQIAPYFGRTQLPVFKSSLKPQNIIYPLCFRNYVDKKLYNSLQQSIIHLSHLGIEIAYLDANFPFIDGFPLFPHLSHNDGKKIDIAFMYLENNNKTDQKPSFMGYGAYVKDINPTAQQCKEKGYWQYGITKYLSPDKDNTIQLDKENTKTLIQELLYRSKNSKIFIEPYLKKELALSKYDNIRFHGCQAVRHDDHIHFEIK